MNRFDDPVAFLYNLQRLMRKHAVTNARLAREAGVPSESVSRWLRGHRIPRRKSMEKLDQAMLNIMYPSTSGRRRRPRGRPQS